MNFDHRRRLNRIFGKISVFLYGILDELWPSNKGRSHEQYIYWIHDTHFACFAILEFLSINHCLICSRHRQIFLNPVFPAIFSCHFFLFDYWPWDKDSKKKLKIIQSPPLSFWKLILVGQHCSDHESDPRKRKIILYFFLYSYLFHRIAKNLHFRSTRLLNESRNEIKRRYIDWIIDYGEIKKMGFVVAFTCILDYISATLSISTLEQYLENGKISSALGMGSLMCLVVL